MTIGHSDLQQLDKLAESIREDASRARELHSAIYWLERADEEIAQRGGRVTVRHNTGNDIDGADRAATEIARHYQSLYPQAIALVREMCRHELQRIHNRYLPLLMPVSQGSEG